MRRFFDPKDGGDHVYRRKIAQMILRGQLPPDVQESDLDISHDEYCKIFSGGLCNCQPSIRYNPYGDIYNGHVQKGH